MISHQVEKFNLTADKLILFLLTLQTVSSFFSVALNSIAFGIWGGLWIIQIIINRKVLHANERLTGFKWINISIAAYVIIEFISRLNAVIPDNAFIGMKRLLLLLIFYVAILNISKLKQVKIIYFGLLCVAGLVSIYELAVYFIRLPVELQSLPLIEIRINYFGYPLSLGQMKMFLLVCLFPLMLSENIIFGKRKYFLLLTIPIFISMILTQSRNVFLAFFICFVICTFIMNRKVLLTSLGLIVIAAFLIPGEHLDRFKSIADPNHLSNKSRIVMWQTGWQMFLGHPLTGVGDNEITKVYKMYKDIEYDSEGSHLHNNFIMILATTGIFGFIAWITFFILILRKFFMFYKSQDDHLVKLISLGGILLMISFFISGFFEWSFGDHKAMSVFFFLLAMPFVVVNIFKLQKN